MSDDYPPLCVCGHFHGGTCHCGCHIYEPEGPADDDSVIHPDHRADPYEGQYGRSFPA